MKEKQNAFTELLSERVFAYLDSLEKRTNEGPPPPQAIGFPPGGFPPGSSFFHGSGAPNMPPLKPFTDDRGTITNVAESTVGGVQVITSKAGSTRAKHIHKSDTHVCYVVSGKLVYHEKGVRFGVDPGGLAPDPLAPLTIRTYGPGDRFVTGPMIAHQMDFLEDTVMVVCSEHPRDPASYDEDIVRFSQSLAPTN